VLFEGSTFVAFWYVYAALWLATGFAVSASRRGDLQSPSLKDVGGLEAAAP
jgi:hypothetical protein